jgi:hypothetical protein
MPIQYRIVGPSAPPKGVRRWGRCASAARKCSDPDIAARAATLLKKLRPLLAGDLVVDALDVEVHAEDLAVGEVVAVLALDCLALLVGDRTCSKLASGYFFATFSVGSL